MKKHQAMLLSAAILTCGPALALVLPLGTLQSRQAVRVNTPVYNDTVDAKGNKFDNKAILGTKVSLDTSKGIWKPLEAGKDSVYRFELPGTGKAIYVVETRLRPENYMKGTLNVASNVPFEVYLNGESKATKTTVEDAITAESSKKAELTLLPEQTYQVAVKMIADAKGKAPELKLNFVPDKKSEGIVLHTGAGLKNRFLLGDTDRGERTTNTSVSPDGKYVIARFLNRFADSKTERRTEIIDCATGKTIMSLPKAEWMPKGSTLYFTRKSNEGFDIYTIELPTMRQRLLYSDVPSEDFVWSPNADYIIYYSSQAAEIPDSPLRRYASPDDRIAGNRERSIIMKYDFDTATSQPVTFGTKSASITDISADGKYLLFMTQRETPSEYPFYKFNLMQLDVNTMKVDTLIADNPFITNAIYSPDAKQLLVVGSPRAFGETGLNIGNQPIPNDFDSQAYLYNIPDKKVKALTKDFNPSLAGEPVWNHRDGKVYFRANDGFFVRLYSLDPANDKITRLPVDVQTVNNFSVGDSESDWLSYCGQGDTYSGMAYLLNLKKGSSKLIADPLRADLNKLELGETTPWTFTASDGTLIDGTMTLPPNFDSSKKYPLIVYYYGGTSPSQHGLTHPYVPQLFASRDYVVYVVNPSGTYGYGQEFSARHVNAWGKRTADDIIEGVKKFCKEHPFIDSKKIGCMGASYGGFMTQYLQTRTNIFAAAISHAGISDVTSYWGEGYWGYSYNSVAAAESYPWTNPELFTKQGSLFNADKIHTPLLLIHGTADTNVPIGESVQLFNALRILGRDVEFISVDGENHTSGSFPFEKRLLWQNTVMAWFAKYLKDDPRWWNDMYPDPNL